MQKHYINLTNGIEWIYKIGLEWIEPNDNGIRQLSEFSIIRIPSTYLEKKAYLSLFLTLDANFLMNCAIGNEIHVYDCGCRREMSKVISFGIPLIQDILNHIWYKHEFTKDNYRKIYEKTFVYHDMINLEMLGALKEKYAYFRRYCNLGKVMIVGHSMMTEHDGNRQYYQQLVK